MQSGVDQCSPAAVIHVALLHFASACKRLPKEVELQNNHHVILFIMYDLYISKLSWCGKDIVKFGLSCFYLSLASCNNDHKKKYLFSKKSHLSKPSEHHIVLLQKFCHVLKLLIIVHGTIEGRVLKTVTFLSNAMVFYCKNGTEFFY